MHTRVKVGGRPSDTRGVGIFGKLRQPVVTMTADIDFFDRHNVAVGIYEVGRETDLFQRAFAKTWLSCFCYANVLYGLEADSTVAHLMSAMGRGGHRILTTGDATGFLPPEMTLHENGGDPVEKRYRINLIEQQGLPLRVHVAWTRGDERYFAPLSVLALFQDVASSLFLPPHNAPYLARLIAGMHTYYERVAPRSEERSVIEAPIFAANFVRELQSLG